MKVVPGIRAASSERSLAFHRDVLGFAPVCQMPSPDGTPAHAEVRRGDVQNMIDRLDCIPAEARRPTGHRFNIRVEVDDDFDLDAHDALARERGATIASEMRD